MPTDKKFMVVNARENSLHLAPSQSSKSESIHSQTEYIVGNYKNHFLSVLFHKSACVAPKDLSKMFVLLFIYLVMFPQLQVTPCGKLSAGFPYTYYFSCFQNCDQVITDSP